jgi:hypothetical protein
MEMPSGNGNRSASASIQRRRRAFCLRRRALQHGVRKIRAENLGRLRAAAAAQRERHVSGAATKIKHASFGTPQNGIEGPRRAPPPQAVNVERENMIQQIVARRNRSEHLPDGAPPPNRGPAHRREPRPTTR